MPFTAFISCPLHFPSLQFCIAETEGIRHDSNFWACHVTLIWWWSNQFGQRFYESTLCLSLPLKGGGGIRYPS